MMIRCFVESIDPKQMTTKLEMLLILCLVYCFVLPGTFIVPTTSYAEDWDCLAITWNRPSLREGDRVIVRNVNPIGLKLRKTAAGRSKNVRVFDGAKGTILRGPEPVGSHIWYEVKWDNPVKGIRDGWSAGIIGQRIGCSLKTLWLHEEGDKAKAIRTRENKQQAEIAAKLFKLPAKDTNYDYNPYGSEPGNRAGYRGGHAGWDAQTQNVAGLGSENMPFYSLTSGTVIRATLGDPSKLSVIAVHSNDDLNPDGMTTLYLHARAIFVYLGQEVSVGDCLGIQGNTGLWPLATAAEREDYLKNAKKKEESYREHVHIEVRTGRAWSTANGAGISQGGDHPTIDPIPYLHNSIIAAAEKHLDPPDVNRDGKVDGIDFNLVRANIGKNDPKYDVNKDGVVDPQDLVTIIEFIYNYFCAVTTRATPKSPVYADNLTANFVVREGYVATGDRGILRQTVQQLLDLAREIDDGSFNFKRGIVLLEHLLELVDPQKTVLLANYPNPFNPETWIPYQLAEPADVTLTIYAVDGSVVRTLALGHQPIGNYHGKSRAAHWDGKNALGEPVTSGVYFYTLTAGEFTATRKMLIRK